MSGLVVVDPGPLALVQDAGRPGHAAVGVSPSGAADRAAYRLGQRLVGGPATGAALELLLGGLVAVARGEVTIAVTGAPAPLHVAGGPVPHATAVAVHDGETIELGMPPTGLRCYLAVRGGLAVPPVLGSRSTDTLSGLGPAPVAAGDVLPVGDARDAVDPALAPGAAPAPAPTRTPRGAPGPSASTQPAGTLPLRLLPGPRTDWLADPARLDAIGWMVSPASDRVGLRVLGPALERVAARRGVEVPSEGLVRGAVQLPPNGLPVLLLADHPVTGGYPVVGVLTAESADRAAQVRPGDPLRLQWVEAPPR